MFAHFGYLQRKGEREIKSAPRRPFSGLVGRSQPGENEAWESHHQTFVDSMITHHVLKGDQLHQKGWRLLIIQDGEEV